MSTEKMREAFELSYAKKWQQSSSTAAQYSIEHLCNELKEMRDGNKYGEGQNYLNFMWEGWQDATTAAQRDAMAVAKVVQTAIVGQIEWCGSFSREGAVMNAMAVDLVAIVEAVRPGQTETVNQQMLAALIEVRDNIASDSPDMWARVDAAIAAAEAALPAMTRAATDVLAERSRQIEAEGWTPEHDDAHGAKEMAEAAACYSLASAGKSFENIAYIWPWEAGWFKPADDRRNLVKAAALLLAEIERLDRAATQKGGAA